MLFLAATDSSAAGGVVILILFCLALLFSAVMYFVPLVIAAARRHPNALAIAILNVFTGWTFVGWIISLVWALTNQQQPQTIVVAQPIQSGTVKLDLPQVRDIQAP